MAVKSKRTAPTGLGPDKQGVQEARPLDLWAAVDALQSDLAKRLVAWQAQSGRHHLPWQQTRDPYRVWLSEIMLQQTQVSTVLGYYERFLQRFPTVGDLAAAPLDDVLTLWAGLGYYSRARNLHRCAQAVVAEHGGQFPSGLDQLVALPGIGPSTAAAIASFCFGVRTSIMDGNVKRVLSRALNFDQDLALRVHEKALWATANALVPEAPQDMPAYTQGLMDLGATICTPKSPSCLMCPWSDLCRGRQSGDPERLPIKTRKLKRSVRESWVLWWECGDAVWLSQMPATGIWAGLWTMPLLEDETALDDLLGPHQCDVVPQPPLKHVLTHLDWHLRPKRWVTQQAVPAVESRLRELTPSGRWVPLSELDQWGLPAPFRKWLVGA